MFLMNQKIQYTSLLVLIALIVGGFTNTSAQSYADAVEKFNDAQELLRANDLAGAKNVFQEAISISRTVGSEADELRARAERQIPNIQFTIARGYFSNRNFERAITEFEQALEYAEQYNETQIINNVRRALPVAYLQWGNQEFRNNNNDKAEELYRRAIELNANYARAYYQLGLIERRRGNTEQALELYDQAILIARNLGDTEVENLAETAARDFLTFLGATATENGRYRQAIEYLERSLEYDMQFADTFYRLAEAQNNLALWDEAVRSAEQALRFERGGQVARAKIHFELGIAHMNRGQEARACESFRNASFGAFRAAAEHHIEHELNCR